MRVFGFALALGALLIYPSFGYAEDPRESLITDHVALNLQNDPVRHVDLDHINQNISPTVNITNNAVSINGSQLYFGSSHCFDSKEFGITIKECGFLPTGQPEVNIATVSDAGIEFKFRKFLTDSYGLDESEFESATGIFIADIEHPVHLGHEMLHNPHWVPLMAREFNRRMAVMKKVLPNAKIAIFGPHIAKINESPENQRKRLDVLVEATLQGMFDNVDYLAFPLYQRKAPEDFGHIRAYERAPIKLATHGIEFATVVSFVASMRGLDVKPFPQLNVEHLGSRTGEIVDPGWMQRMIEVIKDYDIEEYGYWHANDTTPEDVRLITDALMAIYETDGRLQQSSASSGSTGE